MLDKLQRLKASLEFSCKRFEEDNAEGLKDYKDTALYMCNYVGNHVDDAFELGTSFGIYFADLDMLEEINKIIEEGK